MAATPDTAVEFAIYPQLEGKVAIVTGSSRGLGKNIARGLLANNVNVVLNGIDADRLNAAAQELDPSRERVLPVVGDISVGSKILSEEGALGEEKEEIPSTAGLLFSRGSERWSTVPEIIVHAAGVNKDNLFARPRQTREDRDAVNGIKVDGTWELVDTVYGPWSKTRSGLLIGLSSVSRMFMPIGQSLYSAGNAWMENFLTVIDKEATSNGKRDGVRYIAMRLGPAEEGMMLVLKEKNPKMYDYYVSMMPNKELISPYTITNRILELASGSADPRPQSIDILDGGFDPNLAQPQE